MTTETGPQKPLSIAIFAFCVAASATIQTFLTTFSGETQGILMSAIACWAGMGVVILFSLLKTPVIKEKRGRIFLITAIASGVVSFLGWGMAVDFNFAGEGGLVIIIYFIPSIGCVLSTAGGRLLQNQLKVDKILFLVFNFTLIGGLGYWWFAGEGYYSGITLIGAIICGVAIAIGFVQEAQSKR